MADRNKQFNDDYDYGPIDSEEFTLESILAEYKGSAFIDGDKKTPREELTEKADRIIFEATGKRPPANETVKAPPVKEEEDELLAGLGEIFAEHPKKREEQQKKSAPAPTHKPPKNVSPEPPVAKEPERSKVIEFSNITEEDIRFFENFTYASAKPAKEIKEEVRETLEESAEPEPIMQEKPTSKRVPREKKSRFGKAFKKLSTRDEDTYYDNDGEDEEPEEEEAEYTAFYNGGASYDESEEDEEEFEEPEEEELPEPESLEPEPDLLETAKSFAAGRKRHAMKCTVAFAICTIMAIFTFVIESGRSLPFGLGDNLILIFGILLLMQLLVMLLGIKTLIEGITDLIRLEPGAETLVTLSCAITTIGTMAMICTGQTENGLPFCVVSAFSLAFAMHGKKHYRQAMRDSLRMATVVSEPYGVIADDADVEDRCILKKVSATSEGFYRNITVMDIAENAYSHAAPLLIVAAFIFALLASIAQGRPEDFTYTFTALVAVSASFSALTAYNTPFKIAAEKGKKSGWAIAGWGGACSIYSADGMLITDEDVFPVGTVSISGIKLLDKTATKKLILNTASLIIASESGLSKVFSDLLKSQGILPMPVTEFTCYDGGIGGRVRDDKVLCGSAGFMNLMGIRIPGNVNSKSSIFTAVNGELIGVFAISYMPANSVQSAMVSILKTGISMVLAVRDFNMTPLMLQQRFKISMDGIEYIPAEDTYRLSENKQPETCDVSATLCREGLGPFAEAAAYGRKFKIIATLATVVSLIGLVFGVMMVFFLCWNEAFASASAGRILIYMLAAHAIVSILIGFMRRKRKEKRTKVRK